MVSDNCSSIWCPWVEMSSGGTYICVTMGYADASAMTTRTTAKILPICAPHLPGGWPGRKSFECVHSSFRAKCFYITETGSVGLRFEDKVCRLRFVARNGDFLALLTIGLVPSSDGVLAREQIGKIEATIFSGNRMVGVLQHRKSAVHPRMNVALHRDELHLVVLINDGRSARRLRVVPLAIDLGQRVDVVGGLILIQDFERLVHLKRKNMRPIAAALLRENCRLRGRSLIRRSCRNVHHDIYERIVRAGNHRFGRRRSGVLFRATRLFGHVDRFLLGWRSLVSDLAADGAAARRPGRHGGRGKNRHSCHISLLGSHPLTPPETFLILKLLLDAR